VCYRGRRFGGFFENGRNGTYGTGQGWSRLAEAGRGWSRLVCYGRHGRTWTTWTNMDEHGRTWTNMDWHGRKRSGLVKFGRTWSNPVKPRFRKWTGWRMGVPGFFGIPGALSQLKWGLEWRDRDGFGPGQSHLVTLGQSGLRFGDRNLPFGEIPLGDAFPHFAFEIPRSRGIRRIRPPTNIGLAKSPGSGDKFRRTNRRSTSLIAYILWHVLSPCLPVSGRI